MHICHQRHKQIVNPLSNFCSRELNFIFRAYCLKITLLLCYCLKIYYPPKDDVVLRFVYLHLSWD